MGIRNAKALPLFEHLIHTQVLTGITQKVTRALWSGTDPLLHRRKLSLTRCEQLSQGIARAAAKPKPVCLRAEIALQAKRTGVSKAWGWKVHGGFGEGKGSRFARAEVSWEGLGMGQGGGRHGEGETVSPGGKSRVSAAPCLGLCPSSTAYQLWNLK